MQCQSCKQANATVHLTDIQPDGEPVERHLCEACAVQEGVTMKPHEPINTMLEKFVKVGAVMQEAARRECPNCGITFGEFRAQGLLGCPLDYEVFGELLTPLLARAHDEGTQHVGKRPGQPAQVNQHRTRLRRLRRELADAVETEQYEEAARLRDELKRLEAESADEH
jgi:protein arginine kinase activator